MFEQDRLNGIITKLALAFLFCASTCARQQAAPLQSPSDAPARVPARPPDIISDNLDRVAASADQILAVVNNEAGLMVELKRLLAQDAGASGQILEESDLTDGAVSERLRSDLRARVLATHLLQRYGYLVPRLNPDSDLEAEQTLVRQERARMLARAACDPRSVPECALPSALPEDRQSLPAGPTSPGRAPRSSVPVQRAEDASLNEMMPPVSAGLSQDQRPGHPAGPGSPETVLTSSRVETNPLPNHSLSVSPPDQSSFDAGMPPVERA